MPLNRSTFKYPPNHQINELKLNNALWLLIYGEVCKNRCLECCDGEGLS